MILDLTQLGIAQSYDGTVTFLGETAGFLNVLGMYRIVAEGVIYDVEIIFANASAAGSGGDLTPGVSMTPITLQTSDSIGFFILPNGWSQSTGKLLVETAGHFEFRTATGAEATISDLASPILYYVNEAGVATAIKSQYGTTTFHSAASADTKFTLNGDALNHVRFSVEVKDGKVLLSMTFEDLWKGGDKDYNDVEFRLDLGAVNTVALAPELAPLLPKLLTTEADLAIVTAKGERSIDLLSNDSFAATAPGARITHISGQAISEGQTITLASGERLTLLKDGVIRIEATATSGSTEVTYFVADDNGGFGVGTLKIVTDAVDGTSGNDQMHGGVGGTAGVRQVGSLTTLVDQDWCPRHPSRPRNYLPTGRGGRHRPDGARHPRRHPPITNATAMRMTAIHAQTERKRQDRSARCAEKHRPWARKQRLRGLIRPVPAACATAHGAQSER